MQKLSTHKTLRSTVITALAAAAAIALFAAPAEAKQLGHVAKPDPGGGCTNCWDFSLADAPRGPSYAIPQGRWKITSWSVTGNTNNDAAARLLVVRAGSTPGTYQVAAMSRVRQVREDKTPTFRSSIRVRGGDRLGLTSIGNLGVSYLVHSLKYQLGTTQPGCLFPALSIGEPFGAGTACPLNTGNGHRINIAATIKRRG
jgi:hypothetical protein